MAPSLLTEVPTELVAEAGTTNVDGAATIELLMTTDKKVFSVAVYPTLDNEVLKMAAFKVTNKVEVEAGKVAYSTATMTVFDSLVLIHWLTLVTLSLTDGTTKKKAFCCSLERPFGMIEVLIEMKTVLDLLLMALWVIWISFKLATFKIQSAPLKTYPEAQVAHSVALTQSAHFCGQVAHDPVASLNFPDPQLFDSAHLLEVRLKPAGHEVQ